MSQIDSNLIPKIERGKYLDLAKLLPKQKIIHCDGRLNMFEKDGMSYLQPANELEAPQINNLKQWEQAFELYAGIYCGKNP